MGEFSLFWPTGTTGDGASTYTDSQLFAWLRRTFNGDNYAAQGPLVGYNGELAVTPGTGKVTIATGAAYVYGIPYELDASLDVTIPTPVANTRVDRIVLRANWTAKTVRVTRIAGTEGAGVPAITQNPGSLYDVPLAQVSVTTGGVITVTDERQFCRFATRVASENIDDNAVTTAKVANGAITAAKLSDGAVGTNMLADGAVTSAKIADGTIIDADISSSAAIAQSKISNASRAIDADKVDGMHASDFVRSNDHRMVSLVGVDNDSWPIPTGDLQWRYIDFQNDVTGLVFTLNGPCDLKVDWACTVKGSTGGTWTFRAQIDGTLANDEHSEDGGWTGCHIIGCHFLFENIQAGNHTMRMQFKHSGSALNPGIGWRRMTVEIVPR